MLQALDGQDLEVFILLRLGRYRAGAGPQLELERLRVIEIAALRIALQQGVDRRECFCPLAKLALCVRLPEHRGIGAGTLQLRGLFEPVDGVLPVPPVESAAPHVVIGVLALALRVHRNLAVPAFEVAEQLEFIGSVGHCQFGLEHLRVHLIHRRHRRDASLQLEQPVLEIERDRRHRRDCREAGLQRRCRVSRRQRRHGLRRLRGLRDRRWRRRRRRWNLRGQR
jgi:hypothetical protein